MSSVIDERKASMIFEIAEIRVVAGHEQEFEASVQQAVPLFERAKGCRGMELQRTIETTGKYRLVVRWDTVDDHMVGFRGSPDFQEWRRLVGPHLAQAPVVEHTACAVSGF
jgi:heme-degrading monooxygenase HmoA